MAIMEPFAVLLEHSHGVDVNQACSDGRFPLQIAVENQHVEVIRVLLKYGADPNKTYLGTPLISKKASTIYAHFNGDATELIAALKTFYTSLEAEKKRLEKIKASDPRSYDI